MTILVYGAGAYGAAVALSLARQGRSVVLSGRAGASLQQAKANALLAHKNLRIQDYDPSLLVEAQLLLLAVKSQAVRESLALLADDARLACPILCLAKGMEVSSGLALYELDARLGFLSGPSFAAELMQGKPAALSVAHTSRAQDCAALLGGEQLRIYPSIDVVGISTAGAMKNIIAIACGIAQGRDLGASAQASLLARGAVEIARFIGQKGGDSQSMMQPAGIGDLALTCFSDLSRNRQFGIALGQGETVAQAQARIGLVEGASCARALVTFLNQQPNTTTSERPYLPITSAVDAIITGTMSIDQAYAKLMAI